MGIVNRIYNPCVKLAMDSKPQVTWLTTPKHPDIRKCAQLLRGQRSQLSAHQEKAPTSITGKPADMSALIEKDDIIQIAPDHKWGGCLAIVDEPKSFGCQAYVPSLDGSGAVYIRLSHGEYEPVGAKARFVIP